MPRELTLDYLAPKNFGKDDWYEKPVDLSFTNDSMASEGLIEAKAGKHFLILEVNESVWASFLRKSRREVDSKDADQALEQKFFRLADKWRDETATTSSMTDLVMNQNYQNIIGMGPTVIPLLLRELKERPDHWFWALKAITEEDPTTPEDAGDIQKMTEAWLNWAKSKGYL